MGKKVLVAAGLVLFALGGAVVVGPSLLFRDAFDTSHVVSIATTSEYQDPALLAQAWQLPVAKLYRAGLEYQRNGSWCGPASLVNVMHSLGLPAAQATVLEGTGVSTAFGFLPGGLTLNELAGIAANRLGTKVTALHNLDRAAFGAMLQRANDPSVRLVVNFTRSRLFGTGGGHHSPIAGYLEDKDLAFVLDMNEAYHPWLVKADRLYEAVTTVDPSSHTTRGLLLIE